MEYPKSQEGSKQSPAFKSSFSMGGYDFERYHEILKLLDELGIMVRSRDDRSSDYVLIYYSTLKELYINLRTIVSKEIKTQIDEKFEYVNNQISDWQLYNQELGQVTIPHMVINLLEEIHMRLLEIRQISGLGIVIERTESLKKRMNRVLLGQE